MAFGFENATIDAFDADHIAAWLFEDRLDSKGSFDLTNSNGVTFIPGKNNDAANFVRTSSQALEYAGGIIDTSGDFAINFWMNNDEVGVASHIVSTHHVATPSPCPELYWFAADNKVQAQIYNTAGTPYTVLSLAGLTNATWYMITIRMSGTTFELLINNVSQGTDTVAGTMRTPDLFRVGCRAFGTGNNGFFDGRVDAGDIWEAAISNAAITALWNGGTGRFYHEIVPPSSFLTRGVSGVLDRTSSAVLVRVLAP